MKENPTLPKFHKDQRVNTFDPNFEPLVLSNAVGTITKIYESSVHRPVAGYDVLIETTEGSNEEFYFHEYELTEAN